MNFYIFNTLSRKKEAFIPLCPNRVSLYVCGPTVYDRIHLGNARCLAVFDVLYRLLRVLFSSVTYVRNITDVDDKIIQRSQEKNVDIALLTQQTLSWFFQDVGDLGLLNPTHQPRATDFIPAMVSIIQTLVHKRAAYETKGHVFFSVRSWGEYGSLCGVDPAQMRSGARVAVDKLKKDPLDFVLWKPSEPSQLGWDSPWGRGRPGWHIECSAMSSHFLGPVFDIHGGGRDLLFPHHENERTQTCVAFDQKESSRYWMHTDMLTVDGKKMSKSVGNFITLRDALTNTRPETLLWALLSSHYRHGMDWNNSVVHNAQRRVDYLYNALEKSGCNTLLPEDIWKKEQINSDVLNALCDDLNTPKALSALHELASCVHRDPENVDLSVQLLCSAQWLGLVQRSPSQWFRWANVSLSEAAIDEMVACRDLARQNKDYVKADQVRKRLEESGVVLEDTPWGTKWRHA